MEGRNIANRSRYCFSLPEQLHIEDVLTNYCIILSLKFRVSLKFIIIMQYLFLDALQANIYAQRRPAGWLNCVRPRTIFSKLCELFWNGIRTSD